MSTWQDTNERKILIDNFNEIEPFLEFEKNTFYKFMVIVRNKDGRTPIINKEAMSGETTIKQWYINSEDYYKRVKSEMIALAEATRGRLYMCIERKSSYKMFLLLLDKVTAIIKEFMVDANATPKRLNKIVNSITSDIKCTDKDCKTWMYDIDNEDKNSWYRSAIIEYVVQGGVEPDKIQVLRSKSGWHIITPRKYRIEDDWQQWISDKVIEYAKEVNPKLTIEESLDIIHMAQEIQVQANQLCLVYYSEVKQ